MSLPSGYTRATRHPWPSLLFVLPLLVAYEAGVFYLGGANPETIRNGADHWLRCALGVVGVQFFWVPPAVLAVAFTLWTVSRWADRPGDLISVLSGMVLESVAFALGLWAMSRLLTPVLQQAGIELNVGIEEPASFAATEPALRQVITYLGAGIYEEAVFRLSLFTVLVTVLRVLDVSRLLAVALAAAGSAVLFSVAHHVGPYGQPYSNYLFLFRLLAGVYFALLYELRGFGIAVGSHACYNVMVSVG
ncbi:MAG: CPBP family glutamic-type intramembrane protease [Gemmataceae bacterium]